MATSATDLATAEGVRDVIGRVYAELAPTDTLYYAVNEGNLLESLDIYPNGSAYESYEVTCMAASTGEFGTVSMTLADGESATVLGSKISVTESMNRMMLRSSKPGIGFISIRGIRVGGGVSPS